MTTEELLGELATRVPPSSGPHPAAAHLQCESMARALHLAAGRADWDCFDGGMALVARAWAEGGVPMRGWLCRHFLPVLHLTGIPLEHRLSALRRMPMELYREWRELNSLLDEAREALG